MRHRYVVSYDVSDPKRLRRIFKVMRGFGDHIQLSVFQCDLSAKERLLLLDAVGNVINRGEDQVVIIDLGPAEGRGKRCISTLGRKSSVGERRVYVI